MSGWPWPSSPNPPPPPALPFQAACGTSSTDCGDLVLGPHKCPNCRSMRLRAKVESAKTWVLHPHNLPRLCPNGNPKSLGVCCWLSATKGYPPTSAPTAGRRAMKPSSREFRNLSERSTGSSLALTQGRCFQNGGPPFSCYLKEGQKEAKLCWGPLL